MCLKRIVLPASLLLFAAPTLAADVTPPEVLVPGVAVELVASEPDIVTPVGVAFDNRGRMLVVESHTHKRQAGYDGPQGDRVRTLTDTDGDGVFDTWGTFAEGFTHALNVKVHPASGDVFLVCRNDVHRLRDANNDGVADEDEVIVRCKTAEKYPHNGLGGLEIEGDRLLLGMGENFDRPFTLVGSDGSEITGRGGQGIVFTCDLTGRGLARFAIGVWNPFGLCSVGGEVFAVDNDPHASPPCRLLHVLRGGDYGHRREYSSAGLHPLQAWDGELPGTLGMLTATGEAPCAVLEHNGWLWVTSWGDHRIARYQVSANANGDGYTAKRQVVVQGNTDFRPTGLALGPDGAMYFGDWVSRSYPVHGAGRIWKLTPPDDRVVLAPVVDNRPPLPRSRTGAFTPSLGETPRGAPATLDGVAPNARVAFLQRERFHERPASADLLRAALADADPSVRLFAVRWIAEEHRTEFKQDVYDLLAGPIPNERYYLAVLAAVDWLSHPPKQRASNFADGLLARELRNKRRSPELKTIALRSISPNHKQLTPDAMRAFLKSDHTPLRTEAVRTLVMQSDAGRIALLKEVIADERFGDALRADAVAGLAAVAPAERGLLEELAGDGSPAVRREADRVLRLAKMVPSEKETKPPAEETDAWLALLDTAPGDAAAGRRLFTSAVGARCAVCHQHSGRGGNIGPDLTLTAKKLSRRRLVESILQPSAEIAPQYTPWVLETADGRVLSGLRLAQAGDNGKEWYADSEGKKFLLLSEEIDYRAPSAASIMPQGLEQTVSVQDLRDLIAFLSEDPG